MQTKSSRERWIPMLALLTASVLACNLQTQSGSPTAGAPTVSEATVPLTQITSPVAATAAPTSVPTATATTTQGARPVVNVSASGGRLNVRRGPGPDYDTVGAFLEGQTSTATGRNADGKWILINIPNTSKSLGWITLETKYTTVTGAVAGLPPMQMAPALPAFIRNCTGREMLINPIGSVLLPRGSAPENQLQFFPGEYSVVDMETETNIGDITVFEGKTIDIKEDSSGKKSSCP